MRVEEVRPSQGSQHRSYVTVNPRKLQTGLRPNSAGILYTSLLRIEAIGFPTFGFCCILALNP